MRTKRLHHLSFERHRPGSIVSLRRLSLPLIIVASSWCMAGCSDDTEKPNYRGTQPRAAPHSAPATARLAPEVVTALGRLEPGEGVIDVGAPPGDRILRLEIQEQQSVEAGDVLAILEARDERAAERDVRQARVVEFKRQLERAHSVGRLTVEAQTAEVRRLEADLELAKSDLRRTAALVTEKVIPDRDLEYQKTVEGQAQEALKHARAVLEERRQIHRSDIAETTARLETAKAELRVAEARHARTTLTAPVSGRVLDIFARPGEVTDGTPILRLGETDRMVAVAEIYQTEARFVVAGQRAEVTSPALAEVLLGTVERVGSEIHKNDVLGVDPAADNDARVIETRIVLDDAEAAGRFVHLQVDIEIFVGGEDGSQTSASAP